jgi:hypothetical protein
VYGPEEDRLTLWKERYIEMEITGERKCDIEKKIDLQLTRFIDFYRDRYAYEKVTAVVKRDVTTWLEHLYNPPEKGGRGYAPVTVNNHQAALSRFMKWLRIRARLNLVILHSCEQLAVQRSSVYAGKEKRKELNTCRPMRGLPWPIIWNLKGIWITRR